MIQTTWDNVSLKEESRRNSIFNILPVQIRTRILEEELDFGRLQEIRMRAGQPLLLRYDGKERTLKNSPLYMITSDDVNETVQYAANYSLYAYEQEMRQGYLTIEGGHRIGMAGQVIWDHGRIRNLKYISSVNIRVAHEIPGCGNHVFPYLVYKGDIFSTLIIAPPGCGKTTLLRDLIRQISNGSRLLEGKNVGVVDERSELAGSYMGICQNNLGIRTDIMDACPKAEGMLMLIRSMGPQVIAVDEIGSAQEVQTLKYAMCCGCRMMATVHGASFHEIRGKPLFEEFFTHGLFQRYVVLAHGEKLGQIEGIYDELGERVC